MGESGLKTGHKNGVPGPGSKEIALLGSNTLQRLLFEFLDMIWMNIGELKLKGCPKPRVPWWLETEGHT